MSSTIQRYLEGLQGKSVAVVGIGVSNTPLIQMLCSAGVRVTACDKRSRGDFEGLAETLEQAGAKLQLGEDYLDHLVGQDVIFRTPGMHPQVKQLVEAEQAGAMITSEMEVFFEVCPCPIIAVTGSDGKTTTTTMIAELLKASGKTVYVGGNIGKPLLPEVGEMTATDIAVLELSSFQLMTMRQSPDIALVTNLAPNHLDVHTSMEEYVEAKENIFRYQTKENRLILNEDNEITRGFIPKAKGAVTLFSRQTELEQGVFLKDEAIWVSDDNGSREVLPIADILLPGVHNIENFMATIGALNGMVSDEAIRSFAKTFGGVAHRIELVREMDGVRYYNDSIASSPSRTIAGLRSFDQKVILIAGGYDKQIPFDELGIEIADHVKALFLTGHTAGKIRTAVESALKIRGQTMKITEVEDFKEAVLTACSVAEEGDIVILSPACASFDKFKNFAQRGERFKEIINQR